MQCPSCNGVFASKDVICRTFAGGYLNQDIAVIVEHSGTLGLGVDLRNPSSNCGKCSAHSAMVSFAAKGVICRTFAEEYLTQEIALLVEHSFTLGLGVDLCSPSSNCRKRSSILAMVSFAANVVICRTSAE